MKKFLTSAITLVLILCCCMVTGCKKTYTPTQIKQALNICHNYIQDLNELSSIISESVEFEYSKEAAQQAAVPVTGTDKSALNVDYSYYKEFDFNTSHYDGISLFTPKVLYPGAIGVLKSFDKYINELKEIDFNLGTVYKFNSQDEATYIKITINENKLYMHKETPSATETTYQLVTIDFDLANGIDWNSVEMKTTTISNNAPQTRFYYYVEKATNENRIFNRLSTINLRIVDGDDTLGINSLDFNEVTQKLIIVEEGSTHLESNSVVIETLKSGILAMDFESFVDVIDTSNPVTIN